MFNTTQKHLKIMKKIVWLLMSTMALSLAISCNKDNSNDSDIIGTWKEYLTESYCWDSDGNVVWENKYPASGSDSSYFVFEDNGTGKLRMHNGSKWYDTPLTYSLNGNTLSYSLNFEDEPYSVSCQIEKLTANELVLKFIETFDDGAVEHEYTYFTRVE